MKRSMLYAACCIQLSHQVAMSRFLRVPFPGTKPVVDEMTRSSFAPAVCGDGKEVLFVGGRRAPSSSVPASTYLDPIAPGCVDLSTPAQLDPKLPPEGLFSSIKPSVSTNFLPSASSIGAAHAHGSGWSVWFGGEDGSGVPHARLVIWRGETDTPARVLTSPSTDGEDAVWPEARLFASAVFVPGMEIEEAENAGIGPRALAAAAAAASGDGKKGKKDSKKKGAKEEVAEEEEGAALPPAPACNDRVLVFGGISAEGETFPVHIVWEYDLVLEKWTQRGTEGDKQTPPVGELPHGAALEPPTSSSEDGGGDVAVPEGWQVVPGVAAEGDDLPLPCPRSKHATSFVRAGPGARAVVLWGGESGEGGKDGDCSIPWMLDCDRFQWRRIHAPLERVFTAPPPEAKLETESGEEEGAGEGSAGSTESAGEDEEEGKGDELRLPEGWSVKMTRPAPAPRAWSTLTTIRVPTAFDGLSNPDVSPDILQDILEAAASVFADAGAEKDEKGGKKGKKDDKKSKKDDKKGKKGKDAAEPAPDILGLAIAKRASRERGELPEGGIGEEEQGVGGGGGSGTKGVEGEGEGEVGEEKGDDGDDGDDGKLRIVLIGGRSKTAAAEDDGVIWLLDPWTGRWEHIPIDPSYPLPGPRHGHVVLAGQANVLDRGEQPSIAERIIVLGGIVGPPAPVYPVKFGRSSTPSSPTRSPRTPSGKSSGAGLAPGAAGGDPCAYVLDLRGWDSVADEEEAERKRNATAIPKFESLSALREAAASGENIARMPEEGGGVFHGGVNRGKRWGDGVAHWSTVSYRGNWRDDAPHGEGIALWSSVASTAALEGTGRSEEGKDEERGEEEEEAPSSSPVILSQYKGRWKGGVRHGIGVFMHLGDPQGEPEGIEVIPAAIVRATDSWRRGILSDEQDGATWFGDLPGWHSLAALPDRVRAFGGYTLGGVVRYEGEWENGVPCGRGIGLLSRGAIFQGMWRGLPHGWGRLFVRTDDSPIPTSFYTPLKVKEMEDDGSEVEEEEGKDSDEASLTDLIPAEDDESNAKGGWKLRYEGGFRQGLPHGEGQEFGLVHLTPEPESLCPEGVYAGTFAGGWRHGNGELRYDGGGLYRGGWRFGQRSGSGEERTPRGERYVGKWVADVRSGLGRCAYPDGSVFEGVFAHGIRAGEGLWVGKDGAVAAGKFDGKTLQGHGVASWTSGAVFEGSFRKGKPAGAGHAHIVAGNPPRLLCTYTQDRDGIGAGVFFPNGERAGSADPLRESTRGVGPPADPSAPCVIEVYEGHIKHGERHGVGTLWRVDLPSHFGTDHEVAAAALAALAGKARTRIGPQEALRTQLGGARVSLVYEGEWSKDVPLGLAPSPRPA